jgi:hypothetical protein
MIEDEVYLCNIKLLQIFTEKEKGLFLCQRASNSWVTRLDFSSCHRPVSVFYLLYVRHVARILPDGLNLAFAPCYYFLSRGGSHREGAPGSWGGDRGVQCSCMSPKIIRTTFAIRDMHCS